ncbi:hypothetical protein [Ligilactobacillus equi]|uniref:Uncharacterized protein n=2 Tax=Ligilactobacillus equi TaxID=137357 RepID=V7HZN7_9LACO|nr:hypothetical protein [Ligilactobacillus equi]ETA74481.1 hypothetical protein LEQ_0346 [Ligilactobacillus equi DPC 6820]
MSTNANIGIIAKQNSSTIVWIRCHWDGYPASVGKILTEKYTEPSKVWQLIALGDISSLGENLEPTTDSHSFEHPEENTTIAYHRDRHEDWSPALRPAVDTNLDRFLDVEYAYLFDQDKCKWTCYNCLYTLSDQEFEEAIES